MAIVYLTHHESGLHMTGQAGADVEITPEMIEAGVEAYLAWLDEDTVRPEFGRLDRLVQAVLLSSLGLLQTNTFPGRAPEERHRPVVASIVMISAST